MIADNNNPSSFGGDRPKRKLTEEETYQTIPTLLLIDFREGRLSDEDIVMYLFLKSFVQNRIPAQCWPSLGTIALRAGCSVSKVSRCLGNLERAGHILRKGGSNKRKIELLTLVMPNSVVVRGKGIHVADKNQPALESDARHLQDYVPDQENQGGEESEEEEGDEIPF